MGIKRKFSYNCEMERTISIEPLTEDDWLTVRAIYQEGISTGNATFEEAATDWSQWDAAHLRICRLVARSAQGILGWAALSPVSRRSVYAGVGEVSIYVAERARGTGIGGELISRLVIDSEMEGMWTLQAGIFPENEASLRLHAGVGFRVVGTREKIGCLKGRWRDVILMERRSPVVGR